MKPWSDEAREGFDAYCESRRGDLLAAGADPDEVFADWHAHIARATDALPNATVGAAEVRRLLARLDVPVESGPAPTTPAGRPAAPARRPHLSPVATLFVSLFGVLLPLLTLIVELATSMCAATFFDPLPSWINAALIALVPVANGLALAALRRPSRPAWRVAGWLNGLAIAVSAFYALVFALLTPIALFGILWFGLGFLPLSPLTSFVCALVLRARLRRAAAEDGLPMPAPAWKTLAAAAVLLGLAAAPRIVTLTGIQWAASDDAALRARGLRLLRNHGSEEELLRASYIRRQFQADPWIWAFQLGTAPVPMERIREIYYRVTGRPFNAVKPPPLRGRRGAIFDEAEWDFAQGGEAVAARIRGLALSESRLDGRIEAEAGTAYLEWTMVFRNDSPQQREARAQILLPPGASVSRLTLWIDGEEREAAFGGRSQVREAYKKVVERRRDPVLVTTDGPDRILLQCFPVPPDGGQMKTRIGITCPLVVREAGEPGATHGLLPMPRILERNFGTSGTLQPTVWIDCDSALDGAAPLTVAKTEVGWSARGEPPVAAIEDGLLIRVRHTASRGESFCRDERDPQRPVVVQRLVRQPDTETPRRLAVVIDGSARMAPHASTLGNLLAVMPAGIQAQVFFASDEIVTSGVTKASNPWVDSPERFAGGCDNVRALVKAWDWAAAGDSGAVVWLHATQPIESDGMEALLQRWQRRPDGPSIHAYQFGSGPNRVADRAGGNPSFRPVPPVGDPLADLSILFKRWEGEVAACVWERQRLPPDAPEPAGAVRASDHVVRLWAADEIRRLAQDRSKAATEQAVSLARTWQLVSPVSGAVVLETQAQYRDAGLNDIDPSTAPETIPEPSAVLLALWGLTLVLATRRVVWVLRGPAVLPARRT
jgi:hypothetical protein